MKTKIPMCWLSDGTGLVEWGIAVGCEGHRDKRRIIFEGGGWNWAGDCFLTEEQCRRANRLPPPRWAAEKNKTVEWLRAMADRILDIDVV